VVRIVQLDARLVTRSAQLGQRERAHELPLALEAQRRDIVSAHRRTEPEHDE